MSLKTIPDGTTSSRRKVQIVAQSATKVEEESIRFRAIRFAVLLMLTCQNCSLMMVTSYSRSLPGPQYLASTAVVASEVVKTICVFCVLLYQHGFCTALGVMRTDILSTQSHTAKYAVPAVFYTVQNNLWYYAMSNLDPVTAAVTSQTKVISTALFSVLILKKKLNILHWFAIGVLILGLTIMQMKEGVKSSDAGDSSSIGLKELKGKTVVGAELKEDFTTYYFGLVSMLAACTSSGYAGVYLERLFKEVSTSVWTSNMQLQFFCLPISILTMLSDLPEMREHGPFVGWNGTTCLVVALNALGGFIVSLTMKYADNILKTFAVSMSLVCNLLLSWFLLNDVVLMQDVIGVGVVIGGTWLYNLGSTSTGAVLNYNAILQSEPSKNDIATVSDMTPVNSDVEIGPVVVGPPCLEIGD